MKILKNSHKFYKLFGYCWYQEIERTARDYVSFSINIFFSLTSVASVLISIEYIQMHFDETENMLYAVLQLIAVVDIGGAHFMLSLHKEELSQFFINCQSLVDERKLNANVINECFWWILFISYFCLSKESVSMEKLNKFTPPPRRKAAQLLSNFSWFGAYFTLR